VKPGFYAVKSNTASEVVLYWHFKLATYCISINTTFIFGHIKKFPVFSFCPLCVIVIFGVFVLAIRTEKAQTYYSKGYHFCFRQTQTKIELGITFYLGFSIGSIARLYAEDLLNQDTLIMLRVECFINLFSLMGKKQHFVLSVNNNDR